MDKKLNLILNDFTLIKRDFLEHKNQELYQKVLTRNIDFNPKLIEYLKENPNLDKHEFVKNLDQISNLMIEKEMLLACKEFKQDSLNLMKEHNYKPSEKELEFNDIEDDFITAKLAEMDRIMADNAILHLDIETKTPEQLSNLFNNDKELSLMMARTTNNLKALSEHKPESKNSISKILKVSKIPNYLKKLLSLDTLESQLTDRKQELKSASIESEILQKDSIENSAKIAKILQDKDFVKDVMKSNDYANIAVILEHQSPGERMKSKNQFTDQEKQLINDKINEFENNHTIFKIQENQLSLEYNQTHINKNLNLNLNKNLNLNLNNRGI